MSFTRNISAILLASFLFSCAPAVETPVTFPTYDPFVSTGGTPPGHSSTNGITSTPAASETIIPSATSTRPPTPTRVPLNISPLIGIQNQITSNSPTPDAARVLPTPRQQADEQSFSPATRLEVSHSSTISACKH